MQGPFASLYFVSLLRMRGKIRAEEHLEDRVIGPMPSSWSPPRIPPSPTLCTAGTRTQACKSCLSTPGKPTHPARPHLSTNELELRLCLKNLLACKGVLEVGLFTISLGTKDCSLCPWVVEVREKSGSNRNNSNFSWQLPEAALLGSSSIRRVTA